MRRHSNALSGIVVSAVAILCLALAGNAQAGTKIASFSTPSCPGPTATWRIAYRLYWQSSDGRTTSQLALPEALEQAEGFAADVRNDSACGARIVLDVYDEEGAVWPASTESESVPSDTGSFMTAGDYDWTFFRFPSNGEQYCANTQTGGPSEGVDPSLSRYPVDPEGRLGCAAGPTSTDCLCEPWRTLMEHEWLHAVVSFYNPRLGWPTPDVHGACEHGYSSPPCPSGMTNEKYFADMMQGKVGENGSLRGIQPDEWALQGTPRAPLIQHADTQVRVTADGHVRVTIPEGLANLMQLSVLDAAGQTIHQETLTSSSSEFDLPEAGRWNVCFDSNGSESYYPLHSCVRVVTQETAESGLRRKYRGLLRISHRKSRYRIVAPGLPAGSKARLLVRHAGRRFFLHGQRRGGSARFRLSLRGSKPWRIRLRLQLRDNTLILGRVYVLHAPRRVPHRFARDLGEALR
jgi:hypothetical protein